MATGLPDIERLLREMLDTMAPGDDALARIARLRATRAVLRALERESVDLVAVLLREGEFAKRGYKQPQSALANLLDVERSAARHLVVAAETVTPQDDVAEPELPATAKEFAAGEITIRHVDTIATVMSSRTAQRLEPHVRAHAEQHIAKLATELLPGRLRTYATQYIELLNHDNDDPDRPPPAQVNELRYTRLPGGGGKIVARYDDPVRFEAILAVLDVKSAPLTADDHRTAAERHADALSDVCSFITEHGDSTVLPDHRPNAAVTMQLLDLQNHAAAGQLAFGGIPSPAALRQMCCDTTIIPIVLGAAGQPLDIGRNSRTIPPHIRRAVHVRDRGCAHPGCDRPITWSECHHIIEWAHGGPTSIDNLVLLCKVHHVRHEALFLPSGGERTPPSIRRSESVKLRAA
jgi:hypothetical protein